MDLNQQKKVNVTANLPIRGVLPVPIFGTYKNVKIKVGDIVKLIRAKAIVEEILDNGRILPLDFNNYALDNNGTSDTVEKSVVEEVPVAEVVEETPVAEDVPATEQEEVQVEETVVKPEVKVETSNKQNKNNRR